MPTGALPSPGKSNYSHCDYIFVVIVTTKFTINGVTVTIGYPVTMTSEVTSVGIRDLKKNLSDLVNRVIYRNEVLTVTKNNKPVAVLAPISAYERAGRALAMVEQNPELLAKLDGNA